MLKLRAGPSPYQTAVAMVGARAGDACSCLAPTTRRCGRVALVTGLNGTSAGRSPPGAAARVEAAAARRRARGVHGGAADDAPVRPGHVRRRRLQSAAQRRSPNPNASPPRRSHPRRAARRPHRRHRRRTARAVLRALLQTAPVMPAADGKRSSRQPVAWRRDCSRKRAGRCTWRHLWRARSSLELRRLGSDVLT